MTAGFTCHNICIIGELPFWERIETLSLFTIALFNNGLGTLSILHKAATCLSYQDPIPTA